MTEQIDAEFLAFSELLDNEENISESALSLNAEDAALLLELRRQLRQEQSVPPLPPGFAAETARQVAERYDKLSPLTHTLLRWEPWLRARVASKAGLKVTAAAMLLGLGAADFSWHLLQIAGVLTLVAATLLKVLYQARLPRDFQLQAIGQLGDFSPVRSRLFYLLPALAMLGVSVMSGLAISNVGELSLSFKSQGTDFQKLGLASAAVALGMLISSLGPLLVALEQRTRSHPIATILIQGFCGTITFACLGVTTGRISLLRPHWDFVDLARFAVLVGGVWLTLVVAWRPGQPVLPSWRSAFGSLFRGLFSGGAAVVFVLVFFYQAHLTRDLVVEPQAQTMEQEVEAWIAEQKAIPAQDNAFIELAPYLFAGQRLPGKEDPEPIAEEHKPVYEGLKAGGELYDEVVSSRKEMRSVKEEELVKARKDFLRELPRIRAALAKPHFSYVTDGEYSFMARVPNFILMRAVSQGLEALVVESLDRGDSQAALDDMLLNLDWSSRLREGNLINLMIVAAQTRIATGSLERLVLEGELSAPQLRQLLETLTRLTPPRNLYRDCMLRECYMTDRAFKKQSIAFTPLGDYRGEEPWFFRLVPGSYWESERKAYLNYQLGQLGGWSDLARPTDDDITAMLPWSFTIQNVIPNFNRATAQFVAYHSRYNAYRLVTALELCKRERGEYPEKLEDLVPAYMESLPIDAAHPNLWKMKPGFSYKRTPEGYSLLSVSSVYENISLAGRQSYGPDGSYEPDKSK